MKLICIALIAMISLLPNLLWAQAKRDIPERMRKRLNEEQMEAKGTLLLKRIKVIEQFAGALIEESEEAWNQKRSDTAARARLYRTTAEKFLKSMKDTAVEGGRSTLSDFDMVLDALGKGSLILRAPDPAMDTLIVAKDHPAYFANTVILYLPMYDMEFEGFYFAFKENTDELIYFMGAGGEPNVYREKKKFLNDIHNAGRAD